MGDNEGKERNPKGNKAKTVGDWARALECSAKALAAAVGLVVMILWECRRR